MPERSLPWVEPAFEGASDNAERRVVHVTLPDGQRARLLVPGGLASAQSARKLADEATRNFERHSRALRTLGAAVIDDHAKLARARRRLVTRRAKQLLKGDAKVSARASELERDSDKDWKALEASTSARLLRRQRHAVWHPAVVLSSLPLFAIYGRHNLEHNLTLSLLLLIWLFGDEVTDLLSSRTENSTAEQARSPWWLYLTPVANLVAGWWLLHERQHEPFVSGAASDFERVPEQAPEQPFEHSARMAWAFARAVLAPCLGDYRHERRSQTYVAVVDLTASVAPGFALDLVGLREPPALATISALTWSSAAERHAPRVESLSAVVELGKLTVTVTCSAAGGPHTHDLIRELRVAWVVQVLDEALLSRFA